MGGIISANSVLKYNNIYDIMNGKNVISDIIKFDSMNKKKKIDFFLIKQMQFIRVT